MNREESDSLLELIKTANDVILQRNCKKVIVAKRRPTIIVLKLILGGLTILGILWAAFIVKSDTLTYLMLLIGLFLSSKIIKNRSNKDLELNTWEMFSDERSIQIQSHEYTSIKLAIEDYISRQKDYSSNKLTTKK